MTEAGKRRIYRGMLTGFFAFMLLFTILSRIVDAKETAKVRLAYVSRKSVGKTVEGTGAIEAGAETGVRLVPGLRIGEITASAGTNVKEGDVLFRYTNESILERLEELDKSIRKLKLEMELEEERTRTFQGVTEEEAAMQAVLLAQREKERQNIKAARAEEEYERQVERLRDYYNKRLELSEEELLRASYSDYEQSRTAYKSIKMEKESGLKEIQREIETTEAAIEKLKKKRDKLEEKENGDSRDEASDSVEEELEAVEEEIDELEEKLSWLSEDLEDAEDSWRLKVNRAREELEEKEDIYDRAGEEADSARLALKEAYENGLRQEESVLQAAMDAKELADQGVETAMWELENARRNDSARELTNEQAKRLAALQNESRRLDLEDYEEERAELQALLEAGGAVTALNAGCVSRAELEPGQKTDGSERFLLSSGGFKFKGTFEREGNGSLRAGEEMEIRLEGESGFVSAVISQVDLITDPDKGTVTAPLEDSAAALGQKASFEVKKSSEIYNSVIPLTALKKDMDGWYCLAARRQRTILGEEYRAVRIDLRLVMAGDTSAAVEGALSEEEPVISGSDRVVAAGDRVRPMMDLMEQ